MYLFFAEFSTNQLAYRIYGGLRWGGAVFTGFTVGYRNYEIYVNHTPGSDLRRQNGMFLLLEHTVDGRTTNPVSAEETVSKCR